MFKEKVKNVFIGDTRRLDRGFLKACDAVVTTLGAEGKLALLENPDTNVPPIVTKDGVTVMSRIRFTDKIENFGALQAIQGALVTLERAGDSTTTTAAFMQGFIRNLRRKKFNKKVEKGIKIALEEVKEWLQNLSFKTTDEDLKQIIKVSVNNDEKLAKVIFEAFQKAGETGTVEIVNNKTATETQFIEQNGMHLPRHGYASRHFTSGVAGLTFDKENVGVICAAVWEKDNTIVQTVKNFHLQNGKSTPLIVFIERPNSVFTEEMIKHKENQNNICVVALNGYEPKEGEIYLNDVALLTGAKVYNPYHEKPELVIGLADKVVVTFNTTTISVDNPPKEIFETLEELETATKKDEERIKRLKGKIVIIEVGGMNELQRKEEFDRVEDAVASVKSSKEEGFIVGGGATLAFIANNMVAKQKTKEIQRGYDLVKVVLKQPFIKILENANRNTKQNWWEFWRKDYLKHCNEYGFGYNAVKDEVTNLLDDGVIDSKKSIRVAIESATERAIQMLNINCITAYPEEIKL